VAHVVTAIRDFTERRRAEQALQESEELYRTLVETSPDGIVLLGTDMRILAANQRTAELIGARGVEDLVGRHAAEFVLSEDHERLGKNFRDVIETGRRRDTGYRLQRPDGGTMDVETSASLLTDAGGQPRGVISVVRDVTERNRMQQQLLQAQKLESIGTLAGGIAHDFNNLLAVIVGSASVLQGRGRLSRAAKGLVKDIIEAAERGSSLTHQLLAFARGGLQRPAPTDLKPVVNSVLSILERTVAPQITFHLDWPDPLPRVMADPTQIEQVVMNLCLNAAQASQAPSTVTIRGRTEALSVRQSREMEVEVGEYLRIEVEDEGCGMDAETVERVFEPFFTTKPMGRGMGLAATQGIVRSHQGQIVVDSEPGGGTTITVWLPVVAESVPAPERPPSSVWAETPHGMETVLIVDDDGAVTHTVELLLTSLGYCPVSHIDGDEALAFLDTNREDIDLILLNVHIPNRSCEDMLAEVRRRCPDLPVLLASGADVPEQIERVRPLGISGFVRKPFSRQTLAQAIRQALDHAGRRSE
jgi:PAS domain S-box-containing protein